MRQLIIWQQKLLDKRGVIMKKLLASILILMLCLSILPLAFAEDAVTTQTKGYRDLMEEGAVIDGDGYTIELRYCGPEGKRIFGRIYYPAEFDSALQYTTLVLNHGGNVNADFWDRYYAPKLAKAGYVCYAFDCRSAATGGRGSYGDPTEDGTCSVATYSEDLNAAMDFMLSKEFVDKDHLYICGQSMGGVTVQNVASQRSDEIAGMIVIYGSVSEDNGSMLPDYEAVKSKPYSNGEVLFVQGAQDATLPVERTLENMTWYELSELVYINKAFHGFGVQGDRPAQICVEHMIDFVERTSK